MPREARGCDMHCEGVWIGSKSFTFAVESVQFCPASWAPPIFQFNPLLTKARLSSFFGNGDLASESDCPSLNQRSGIEYGLMAAYAEGLGILRAANVGKRLPAVDAETTPLRVPEHYQYDLNLPDITEVWRRGSVVASWLLDLTATALLKDPALGKFAGRVSDSGEGRWTIAAAIDEAVPTPVLTTALYERFSSRGEADFQNKLLSAMRYEFGGHLEKSGGDKTGSA
jgi:hypothetical protein